MTTTTLYALTSVVAISLVSFVGVLTLSFNERFLQRIIFILVALATGAFLGGAFVHIIPEVFERTGNTVVSSVAIIFGIILFFVFEKILHWHHNHGVEKCRDGHCDPETDSQNSPRIHPVGYSILLSDGIHNLIDGIIIGASYLTSVEIGVAATIAVILHEIPQEFSDFGVLIHSGFSVKKALLINFVSALTAILGAIIALAVGARADEVVLWILPIAAGSFIYIAAADLIPELHKTKNIAHSILQLLAIIAGVAAMLALLFFEVR